MAGGSGTRLWPLSRSGHPKQFLVLTEGNHSLFQQAVARLQGVRSDRLEVASPLVVTNEEHRFLALDQLREISCEPAALLLEPVGRNTAPAVTLAALQARAGGTDPVLVVTPADQTIRDTERFQKAVRQACTLADAGALVILGIKPDRPDTGYGYIRSQGPGPFYQVQEFVEKPDEPTAKRYVAQGYHWNGGMFVLKASTWLKALAHCRPDIGLSVEDAWGQRTVDRLFVRPERAAFGRVPADSVDYAVLERCAQAGVDLRMVELDAGWSDLGAWDAVWQAGHPDPRGNVTHGDTILEECTNVFVHSTSRLMAVVGLSDVVVVETPDAVLVSSRSESQRVKRVVSRLTQRDRTEQTEPRKVHRPWGWYDCIDNGPNFKVKRILVNPGASLSLQMHHHRAEHWIVVEGTAEVTVGDKVVSLGANQSTYIPMGEKHRLANRGTSALEIIEIQSGAYLGEDDIVRFEDKYGRGN
ncbi:MAG: mannose-1-phosphate guanylyltransferase/mannose-6-phosphate isomerase [Ramlibacter sp.]|nr:mannose-1-phosphate guanylyltransferase/mannose-6-phosphate isomerase [Ramlibacter sp.]